jgi:hypothetical protein
MRKAPTSIADVLPIGKLLKFNRTKGRTKKKDKDPMVTVNVFAKL